MQRGAVRDISFGRAGGVQGYKVVSRSNDRNIGSTEDAITGASISIFSSIAIVIVTRVCSRCALTLKNFQYLMGSF